MHPLDEERMAFITENTNYYYEVMPIGLKNDAATYQRLMNKVFTYQIGRIMEVYTHAMVAKTMREGDHYRDIWKIFKQIKKFNMHLNLEKCAFGV